MVRRLAHQRRIHFTAQLDVFHGTSKLRRNHDGGWINGRVRKIGDRKTDSKNAAQKHRNEKSAIKIEKVSFTKNMVLAKNLMLKSGFPFGLKKMASKKMLKNAFIKIAIKKRFYSKSCRRQKRPREKY